MNTSPESCKKIALLLTGTSHHARRAESGIYRFARQHSNWFVVDFSFATFNNLLEVVRDWKPDGVITSLESQQAGEIERLRSCYERVQSLSPAVVNIACDSPTTIASVMIDPLSISQLALDHFIERECKSVVYVGFEEHLGTSRYSTAMRQNCEQRQLSFRQLSVNLTTAELLRDSPPISKELHTMIDGLTKPIGFCCHNELLGAYICNVCAKLGYTVPSDAVVMCQRDEPMAETLTPMLSGIDYPASELGFVAANLLDRLMEGSALPREPVMLAAREVIVRQSSKLEEMPPNIASALEFIHENSCRSIGVPDLMEHQPVSRVTFERHFKAVVGRSPGEEIRRVRSQVAAKLLRETDLAVAEIAQRCGFDNSSKFSLFFKKAVGVNPSKYRQQRGH